MILSVILTGQCYSASQTNQESLQVTQASLTDFRQLSIRVLAAYKTPPRYIGSTPKWHLFLKKESRKAVGKRFSTIFGYKIPRKHTIDNGWDLALPIRIDPDRCPEVSHYSDDRRRFSLPIGEEIADRCMGINAK
ncbi:hypothetical protein [Amphritea sp.]|uniref:hypothetical protein n=1 Tax=Amphritea sp. TaxID=1872502 RepID=UPI003A9125C8